MKRWLLLATAGLLAGCAPTLVPHTAYIPLLRERGEAEARVATGAGGSGIQLGYQLTNRVVMYASGLSYGRKAAGTHFYSAEAGAGYYYPSPNGRWRLGMHAGLAYGAGTSGRNGCFECGDAPFSVFDVRYTYAYVQPTVLLLEAPRHTWGLALLVGQSYYPMLNERRTYPASNQVFSTDYQGHASVFLQPTFQFSYQAQRWLMVSAKVGAQGFLDAPNRLNVVGGLVAQASVHVVVQTRAASRR